MADKELNEVVEIVKNLTGIKSLGMSEEDYVALAQIMLDFSGE